MGLVTMKEAVKKHKCTLLRFGRFSDADEGAKISTLNKAYDRNKHLTEVNFLNGT
jgi:hypothetical protein